MLCGSTAGYPYCQRAWRELVPTHLLTYVAEGRAQIHVRTEQPCSEAVILKLPFEQIAWIFILVIHRQVYCKEQNFCKLELWRSVTSRFTSEFIFMLYSQTDGTRLHICVPSQLRGVRSSSSLNGHELHELHYPLTEA